jgi:TonB family protein
MRLHPFITICVLATPTLYGADCLSQEIPRCDISRLPLNPLETLTDAQRVNFGPYAKNMVAVIRQNWYSRIPPAAMPPISKRGCVVIEFDIVKNGTVSAMRYKLSSGDITLDQAAFDAVGAASTFQPLPAEFKASSTTFRFTFTYNPPEEFGSGAASGAISDDPLIYRFSAVAVSNKGTGASERTSSGENIDQGIRLGTPISAVDPVVPKSLYGKNAAAVIEATIKTDGSFSDLWALGGVQEFEYAALDAIHQWRYTPATLNGNPAEARIFIIFLLKAGEITTSMEPEFPLPDGPKRDMRELYSKGELFTVDMQHVKPPNAVYSPDPEYSQAARVVKREGTVLLGVILGRDGSPDDVWVIRKFVYSNGEQKTFKALGLGLEQKAIEAVRHWKFEPATKDGEPVPVFLNVEVTFRLY